MCVYDQGKKKISFVARWRGDTQLQIKEGERVCEEEEKETKSKRRIIRI